MSVENLPDTTMQDDVQIKQPDQRVNVESDGKVDAIDPNHNSTLATLAHEACRAKAIEIELAKQAEQAAFQSRKSKD